MALLNTQPCRVTPSFSLLRPLTGHRPVSAPEFTQRTVISNEAEFDLAFANAVSGEMIEFAPGTYDWGIKILGGTLFNAGNVVLNLTNALFVGTHSWISVNPAITFYNGTFDVASNFGIWLRQGSNGSRVIGNDIRMRGAANGFFPTGIGFDSNDNEIADNWVHDCQKDVFGISSSSSNPATIFGRNNHIHHNTLQNSAPNTGTGGAAIALGSNSELSTVENNHIDNWNDDFETIEVKSNKNVVLSNLITNCGFGHISNRGGDDNLYCGNYSDGAIFGIRIFGKRNRFIYNYVKESDQSNDVAVILFSGSSNGELAANDNIIECNVFDGFRWFVGADVQGTAPFTGITGNSISNNLFAGAQGIAPSDVTIDPQTGLDANTFEQLNTLDCNALLQGDGPEFTLAPQAN